MNLVFQSNNVKKFVAATDGGLYRCWGLLIAVVNSLNKGYNTMILPRN